MIQYQFSLLRTYKMSMRRCIIYHL